MNAFEEIVKQYLEAEGYWVRQSVKVEISKDDNKLIGLPRPEIDLVAFKISQNEMLLIEVKSLLDSYGVRYEAVSGDDKKYAKRYRLFTDSTFREVVTKALNKQYLEQGLINKETKINYALAAGNIHSEVDEAKIREYFSKTGRGWKLFSPKDVKTSIRSFAERGWEDNLVTMTAKLTKEAIS